MPVVFAIHGVEAGGIKRQSPAGGRNGCRHIWNAPLTVEAFDHVCFVKHVDPSGNVINHIPGSPVSGSDQFYAFAHQWRLSCPALGEFCCGIPGERVETGNFYGLKEPHSFRFEFYRPQRGLPIETTTEPPISRTVNFQAVGQVCCFAVAQSGRFGFQAVVAVYIVRIEASRGFEEIGSQVDFNVYQTSPAGYGGFYGDIVAHLHHRLLPAWAHAAGCVDFRIEP